MLRAHDAKGPSDGFDIARRGRADGRDVRVDIAVFAGVGRTSEVACLRGLELAGAVVWGVLLRHGLVVWLRLLLDRCGGWWDVGCWSMLGHVLRRGDAGAFASAEAAPDKEADHRAKDQTDSSCDATYCGCCKTGATAVVVCVSSCARERAGAGARAEPE